MRGAVSRSWGIFGAGAVVVALLAAAGPAAAFTVNGSVEQVSVTGLTGGRQATLYDARGRKLETRKANKLGGLLFRDVKPGDGYRVRPGRSRGRSRAITVLPNRPAPPHTRV